MMSSSWRDEQQPSLINFISSSLDANSFRLNFVPIVPDFIFNCGGLSVAFVFVTKWDCINVQQIFIRYQMEIGRPTFVLVQDPEMGFEEMVKIAHTCGVCKKRDAKSKMKTEKNLSEQRMDAFLKVVTAIPGIENHDANALNQAIGSVEAIAKACKEYILENVDLSAHKTETLTRFFRDPKFYLGTKIN